MANDDTNHHDGTEDPQPLGNADDARIDEIARAAGSELRRPAPAQGLAGVQRARRNRQITRATAGTTAVLALVVGGLVVLGTRGDGPGIGASDTVSTAVADTTTQPVSTSELETTLPVEPAVTAEPGTSAPISNPPIDADAPSVVYTSTESFSTGPFPTETSIQTLVDPVDGTVIGTEPVDEDKARLALEPFGVHDRSTVDLGDVSYDFTAAATDFFPEADLCGQNTVTVTSPNGSALPERARAIRVSPDDRYVVTLSAECPEAGTAGNDSATTQLPYDLTLQVFDALQPELPGRTLTVLPSSAQPSTLTSSGDGAFMSVSVFDDNATYRIFDLDSGTEIDLGLDVGADCNIDGAHHSRFIGPWIGESSIALSVDCIASATLYVIDLANPISRLVVPLPASTDGGFVSIEVDHARYRTPEDAWFTMCNAITPICWIGHGSDPLIELPGVAQASFLPLGFEYGG